VIMSPSPNIGGTCPPCPIGIDAPDAEPGSGHIQHVTLTFEYDLELQQGFRGCRGICSRNISPS